MITKDELLGIFKNELKHSLMQIERQRKFVLIYYSIAFIPIILAFASVFYSAILYGNKEVSKEQLAYTFVFAFVVIFLFPFLLGAAKKKRDKYVVMYKKNVVSKIISFFEPNWKYELDAHIGAPEYNSSKLFKQPYDIFSGNHLVTGVIDKTDFKSSVLNVNYITRAGGREETHTIFSGFFFHADFNKYFKGETFVTYGDLKSQAMTISGISVATSAVKLENLEFSKLFLVRSTDQIEARYILTPVIMEALLKIKKQYKPTSMFLSFINTRVYCAMSIRCNIFEPGIVKSNIDFSNIEKFYELNSLNSVLIKELNLNTRIWTKT